MTRARAAYMEWAKTRPIPKIDLAGSNLLGCSLDDLPGARAAVDLAGDSPNGYRPLVEEIAKRYRVPPEHVATAGGCSGANFLGMAALVQAGDEVVIEAPHYDPLVAAATMLGANVSFFQRTFGEDYRIDPDRVEKSIGPKTRLIVVTNPHNPSGVLAGEEEMVGLARVAERAGIHILVDEVYLDTIFDRRPVPAATRSEFFVSTNSLTKAYGLASLRCGWALASRDTAEAIRRVRDMVDVWAPIPSDRLSVVAFQNLDKLSDRARGIIQPNARLVRAFFESRPELECADSSAPLAFPRLHGVSDAAPFVRRLFEEHGVAVVPGRFFDSPAHFRLAFGGSTEKVSEGLDAIGRCLDNRSSSD